MTTILGPKSSKKYECKSCNYDTSRQSQMDRHILTLKHIETTKILQNDYNPCHNIEENCKYQCKVCDKKYKHHSSLWKHNKVCFIKKDASIIEIMTDQNETKEVTDKELIMMLLKQNAQLIEQNAEMSKNISNISNNNNTTNSHNKTFNLQFFLNEECKDALNIAEFVSSIKVQLEDLETTGRLGYVEGVSRIINKNLNDLDQTKRPIHCSDAKREVLYIKNDDQWVKENETKPLLTKAIKQIANENIKQIGEWRKKYPDCTDSDSRKNDLYLNIVSNAMSGTTVEEQTTNYEKIISKVAKEVVIEK
jgi:hypothetical protein